MYRRFSRAGDSSRTVRSKKQSTIQSHNGKSCEFLYPSPPDDKDNSLLHHLPPKRSSLPRNTSVPTLENCAGQLPSTSFKKINSEGAILDRLPPAMEADFEDAAVAQKDPLLRRIAGSEEFMVDKVEVEEVAPLSSSCPTESYLSENCVNPDPFGDPKCLRELGKEKKMANFLGSMKKTMSSTKNILQGKNKKSESGEKGNRHSKEKSKEECHHHSKSGPTDGGVDVLGVKRRSSSVNRLSSSRRASIFYDEVPPPSATSGSEGELAGAATLEGRNESDISNPTTQDSAHQDQAPLSDSKPKNGFLSTNGFHVSNNGLSNGLMCNDKVGSSPETLQNGAAPERDIPRRSKFEKFRRYLAAFNIHRPKAFRRKDPDPYGERFNSR